MDHVRRRVTWIIWAAVLGAVTAGLLTVRGSLDRAHVALAYLLVVLGASSRGGRALGLSLAVAAFLCFNLLFVPPYYTLLVARTVDWLVLAAFLTTSLVAAQLLARARSEAASADNRANEVERLSMLGAETLNAGRAEDALVAIAGVIRTALRAVRCEIYIRDESAGATALAAESGVATAQDITRPLGQPSDSRLVEWVATRGFAAVELPDGSSRLATNEDGRVTPTAIDMTDARVLLLPLVVRKRTVGVLRVMSARALTLDASEQRFLEALSYYAALGLDRLRLVAEAERAQALRKADELKNALLASVSHDLRTPLTTIKALAHDIAGDGDERAVIIEEETDRLNHFVADLLDLSRIAGGALNVVPELNAAEDLVGAALQRVSGAARDRELVVSLDPTEPLLVGRFDFVHSLRVLVNLIENALKYAPRGSTVEVEARRAGATLEFVVADRGPGVPENERDRIFEPFYRPRGTMPDAGGVGLGLSIARGLAEAQRGSTRYEPREGGGSRFILSLPAADLAELEAGSATSL